MKENKNSKQKLDNARQKGAELPFMKGKAQELITEEIIVTGDQKRVLDFAIKGHKGNLREMDGYKSCVEKKWIDPKTDTITREGRKAFVASSFGK